MLPFLTHVAPGCLGDTTSSPRHTSPGGHVWQSSVSGLRMYCPSTHARHSCSSSDPVLAVVRVLNPAGQCSSSYVCFDPSNVQLPSTLLPPWHSNPGGLFKAHERSDAHTPPLGHAWHLICPVEPVSTVSCCGGHLHAAREVCPYLPLVVAMLGQAVQSLADLDPAMLLYVSGGHVWHGEALCKALKVPGRHAVQATHEPLSVHSLPSLHGWQSCTVASNPT